MKKKIGCEHFPEGKWRKILLIMKLKLFILLCCIHTLSATTYSQDQKLDVKFENELIVSVLDYLKMQTGYQFFFQKGIVSETEKITVVLKNATLNEVLDKVLKDHGYSYEVLDGVIVVRRMEEQKQEKKTLVGIVTDQKKVPMPGVTVKIFGTNIGTATNAKGQFSLTLPMAQGALEFSFVGYKSQKVNFTGRTKDTLRIVMVEDIQALDEAVVVAYGTTNKREMTGAVSVVKAEELQGIPASDIASLLQGRVAGLDITNMSGAPGGGGTAITIRGYNSLDVEQGRRFSNPLWVVDGVPLNSFASPITGTNLLADINPDMIESVQILKDASSASIYGSRAANGVIIVTTKKGKKNQKATFSINASQSWGIVAEFPTMVIGKGERDLRFKTLEGTQLAYLDKTTKRYKYPLSNEEVFWNDQHASYDYFFSAQPGNPVTLIYQDSLNAFYNNATNFFPAYFRTGKVTNANIQTYGGGERMTYGIGLGYYNEKGVFVGTGYNRMDLNSSLNVMPVNRVNVDLRFNATLTNRDRGEKVEGFGTAPMVEGVPGDPFWQSTLLPGKGTEAWEATIDKLKGTKEKNRSVRLRTNFKIGYEIIEGLSVSTSLATDYSIHCRNYFQPSYLSGKGYSMSLGETGINLMVLNENLLSYRKTIGEDHTFDFLAGFSYQYDQMEYNGGTAENSPSDKIYYAPSGLPDLGQEVNEWSGETVPVAFQHYQSNMEEQKLYSYFGRLEYNYRLKYLLSLSFRRDGSSVFGRNNKWGTFPSVAAGWSFSEEPFIKDNLGWLSFGKLRASWGRSGKMFEYPYLAYGLMGPGEFSHQGNPTLEPVYNGGLYNEDLSWEETDQYDFGLDVDLFEYRLGIVLDYYYRYTDKLLYQVGLPGDYNGFMSQWANAAALSNEGLELLIKYEIFRRSDLYWKISVNGARNWNRIEKSYNGKDLGFGITGKPLNRISGYKTNGYVQKQEDLPLYFTAQGESCYPYSLMGGSYSSFYRPGDYYYVDVDGDGVIFNDGVFLGSALPIISGGIVNEFRWKNFDLNFSMHYSIGRHMVNQLPSISLAFSTDPSQKYYKHPVFVDINKTTFWQQEGDDSDYAQLRLGSEGYVLDRQVEKVNYLKLKTLTVGYNLPKSLISKWGMEQLRVFVSGENLLTFSNYSGMDPEVVSIVNGVDDGMSYPLARKFTLGLTVKF